MILQCSSGSASVSNAPATPSSPTLPVTKLAGSIRPSVIAARLSANSCGVYASTNLIESSFSIPAIGRIWSSCMQTPATTMRVPRPGASRISRSIVPGTPIASNITTSPIAPRCCSAAIGGVSRGSTATSAPIAPASSRRRGEKSDAMIGPTPSSRSAAIVAKPTGPQP